MLILSIHEFQNELKYAKIIAHNFRELKDVNNWHNSHLGL